MSINIKFKNGKYYINNKMVEFGKFKEEENTGLVPHLWWGEIDNPKIVVLAKNPHYDISDVYESQNEELRKIFLENLLREENDKKIINALFSKNSVLSITTTANWWHEVFIEVNNKKAIFDDDFLEKNSIGIFNLFGYSSKSFPYSVNKCNEIFNEDYKKYIKEKIIKADYIFVIWGKKYWDKLGVFENIDGNKILVNEPRDKKIRLNKVIEKFNKNIFE